jgi:hypothetical protein
VDFFKYLEVRDVLFATWATGVVSLSAPHIAPKWVPFLHLGNGAIGSVPVGLVTLFAFFLWLRLLLRPKGTLHISESLRSLWKGSD